jgi:hypothetical protein
VVADSRYRRFANSANFRCSCSSRLSGRRFRKIFCRASFDDRDLVATSRAGLLSVEHIGVLKAVYPVVWGVRLRATAG